MTTITRRTMLVAAGAAAAAPAALAQGATTTLVVPFPPGGSTDIMSRLLQPGMQEILKQTVIVEARGGAGGRISNGRCSL